MKTNAPILLFDGVCSLCNRTVDFVMRADRKRELKFASLQSAYGQKILKRLGAGNTEFTTMILVEPGNLNTQSSAVLRTAGYMGGIWPIAKIFLIVPPFIRDTIYNFVAQNRYRWFGKRDTCRIPTEAEKERFIE